MGFADRQETGRWRTACSHLIHHHGDLSTKTHREGLFSRVRRSETDAFHTTWCEQFLLALCPRPPLLRLTHLLVLLLEWRELATTNNFPIHDDLSHNGIWRVSRLASGFLCWPRGRLSMKRPSYASCMIFGSSILTTRQNKTFG